MIRDTEKAFQWIIDILEQNIIDYRISGGFAARFYGSNRELADIDIEVTDQDVKKVATLTEPFIIFGPSRYKDPEWDIELLTLNYDGQEIDVGGWNGKHFDYHTQQWIDFRYDPDETQIQEMYGRKVSFESLKNLIEYKRKINREVDQEDVRQLTNKE